MQKKAAALGIKSVGISAEELKKLITESEETSPAEETKGKEKKETPNTALIMNGMHEVRRYTLEVHGKEFKDLAEEFIIGRKNYTVVLKHLKKGMSCPACGHLIDSVV